MTKIIKLKESELRDLVRQVITEAQVDQNVMAIQTALKNLGQPYAGLLGTTGSNGDGVDGRYGNNTKKAVIAYQKANNINPTGFVGKVTAPKLGVQPMTGKGGTNKVDPNLFKKVGGQTASVDATGVKKPVLNNITSDTTLSSNINPQWKDVIPVKKISSTKSTPIMKAGQPECAKFVHDFSPKLQYVGNAWDAHNNDSVGKRTWSAFTNLNPDTVKNVESEWLKINQAGGGKEGGQFNGDVKQLISKIVPQTPPVKLQLDNIVGIFYPPSDHHEEAFYKAGTPYFTNVNGKMTPGKNIQSGTGWGMNTHIGIVGAIKDGKPIIFHNVHGTVFADPVDKLYNGGRVAWVKVK
jgi:peptidoglycan hydrolase-like protein with peptidoglycan-binding domain